MITTTRIQPADLTMVALPDVSRAVVDALIGESRVATMAEAGMALADRSLMTVDMLTGAVSAGMLRAWVAYLGDRPVSFHLYAPFTIPGVWAGEIIKASDVDDLRGVGVASTARAVDLVFGEAGARRILVFVLAGNRPATAVLEQLGYTREGVASRLVPLADGTEADAVLYRLHRDEWPGSPAWAARARAGASGNGAAPAGRGDAAAVVAPR